MRPPRPLRSWPITSAHGGWSQETLADIAGLHRTYISGIERTERNVGLDNVEKIAAAFGLPISELLA